MSDDVATPPLPENLPAEATAPAVSEGDTAKQGAIDMSVLVTDVQNLCRLGATLDVIQARVVEAFNATQK